MSLDQPANSTARAISPSAPLAEHDGMQDLRAKLQEIQRLALSTEETAKRMHQLMTGAYQARHTGTGASTTDHPVIAAQQERDAQWNLTEHDKTPTYHPDAHVQEELDENLPDAADANAPILGCKHYMRNVKVQCFDCRRWYTCRHCHDTAPDLPYHHQLNRRKTQHMLCMLCGTAQAAGQICTACGVEAAYYFCGKCKLWDNDSTKRIYHCDDCGICRRGEGLGKDYVHCKRCNVCISISTSGSHPCVERATDCDCPLCLEYLFSSSAPVVSLLCGHYMHASCYKELMNVTYRCPVCSKSAVNMELQWRKLDDEIRLQPMPEDAFEESEEGEEGARPGTPETDTRLAGGLRGLALLNRPASRPRRTPRRIWVGCNDCGGRGWTAFHWLGLKCPICDGYNTNQMNPTGSSATSRILSEGTARQRQHDFTGAAILGAAFNDEEDATEDATEDAPESNVNRSGSMNLQPTLPVPIAHSPTRSATSSTHLASPPRPRSYFLSSSPTSPTRSSWASTTSPSPARRPTSSSSAYGTTSSSSSPPDPSLLNRLYELTLASTSDLGQSAHTATAELLSRYSPSDLLVRLQQIGPKDFAARFGIAPLEFLHRVGRSVGGMLGDEHEKAGAEGRGWTGGISEWARLAGGLGPGKKGGANERWSRRDLAEWESARGQVKDMKRRRADVELGESAGGEEMDWVDEEDGAVWTGSEEEEDEEEDDEDGEEEDEELDGKGEPLERLDFEIFGHR